MAWPRPARYPGTVGRQGRIHLSWTMDVRCPQTLKTTKSPSVCFYFGQQSVYSRFPQMALLTLFFSRWGSDVKRVVSVHMVLFAWLATNADQVVTESGAFRCWSKPRQHAVTCFVVFVEVHEQEASTTPGGYHLGAGDNYCRRWSPSFFLCLYIYFFFLWVWRFAIRKTYNYHGLLLFSWSRYILLACEAKWDVSSSSSLLCVVLSGALTVFLFNS